MSGSFLDTTVVIDAAQSAEPAKSKATSCIAQNQPSSTPYYALRELLAGHLRILCETHNALQAAEDASEALVALLRRSPAEGRKKEARLQAYASVLNVAFGADPDGNRRHLRREMLQALALQAARLWNRAHRLPGVNLVQSLACFNEGKLTRGEAGELRGPRDSFTCIKHERCAAAAYISDNSADLATLIACLHPSRLPPALQRKREISQRRHALKELQKDGPAAFDKGRCRALGDAYFSAMCPAGATLVTTNVVDYVPMCSVLAKTVMTP